MFKFLDVLTTGKGIIPERRKDRKDEYEVEYRAFLSSPAASVVKNEVERLGGEGGTTSSFPYPLTSDTGLELSVMKLVQVDETCRKLPAKLLLLLMKRLELACTKLNETARLKFLRGSIPAVEAVLLADPLQVGLLMLELGLERHLLLTLQFLSRALREGRERETSVLYDKACDESVATVFAPSPHSVCEDSPQDLCENNGHNSQDAEPGNGSACSSVIEARNRELLVALLDTLRVFKVVYVGSVPTQRASSPLSAVPTGATEIFNSQLAKGWVRLRSDSLYAEMRERSCPAEERRRSACGSALRPHTKRDGILLECSQLCVYCSNVAIRTAKQGGEEEKLICEILCHLPLIILKLLRNPTDLIVRNALISVDMQLSRFVAVHSCKDSELWSLRCVSCSLLLVSRLVRESPLLVAQAMASTKFLAKIALVLHVIGVRYKRDESDGGSAPTRVECVRELCALTSVSSGDLNAGPDCVVRLQRPVFPRLAVDVTVDEFLHCYLGLLETQREARRMTEVRRDPDAAQCFRRVELCLLETLSQSAGALSPSSCLYATLITYAVNLLVPSAVPSQERQPMDMVGAVVNSEVYREVLRAATFGFSQRDPQLQHAALYLLYHRLNSVPQRSESNEGNVTIRSEVGIIIDVLCCGKPRESPAKSAREGAVGTNNTGEERGKEGGALGCDKSVGVSLPLCAVLLSSLHGPNSDAVVAVIGECNGVLRLVGLLKERCAAGTTSDDEVKTWVSHLLCRLLRHPDVQRSVLAGEVDAFVSLLFERETRLDAEQMLLALLAHSCAEAEYAKRMDPLVKCIWGALDRCDHLDSEGVTEVNGEEPFLSVLNCISLSLRASGGDAFKWGAKRQLQNALCGGREGVVDAFHRLFRRVTAAWRVVEPSCGLWCIAGTVVALIKENPPLRAALVNTIGADRVFCSFRAAWFASYDDSWLQFVCCILSLVYEDDEAHVRASSGQKDAFCCEGSASDRSSVEGENQDGVTVRNPELLLPLLRLFVDLSEFREEHQEALQYVVMRLLVDVRASQSALWMVGNAGVFDSLSAVVPIVAGTALLDPVLSLITEIASHHVTVRETKQFLMSIAHAKSEGERRLLAPIIIEVLCAASRQLLNYSVAQKNYITFLRHNGPTGLKVVLSDFPLDGYTLCLWLRLESHAEHRTLRCIYSLQSIEKRTVLCLFVRGNGQLAVSYEIEPNKAMEVDLGCEIAARTWVHLAVVHNQTKFPFSASEFIVFINGAKACTQPSVRYPHLQGLFFHLGTRGEDIELRSSRSNFIGQMAAIHFFTCTLSSKLVVDLFSGKSGGENVRHSCASDVAVYVDPRFGERGQLHNLAALLRGKPSERPLITYEGTIPCNTKSMMDSVCILGALQTVVVPLLILLVNPQLPFHCRVPPARRRPATEVTRKAMNEMLKLVETLLLSNIVRADVLEVGLFPMISHALQQFTLYDCLELPQRLHDILVALVADEAIFNAAYDSLFLSGGLFNVCSEPTQLLLVRVQYFLCNSSEEVRHHLRGLNLSHFIVGQMVQVYNGTSEHHQAMREEFFLLMEAVMEDSVTMNDAEAIQRLVSVVLQGEEIHGEVVLQTLVRTRIFVANRDPSLAVFLGKRNFVKDLLPALNHSRPEVRNEVVLLFILLASRSRKTQELLNPTLLASHEAVHVARDISLSWLRDKLNDCTVDTSLYTTLLSALVGRFSVSLRENMTINADDKILFAPVLTPLLLLMKRSSNRAMKERVVTDIATLVQQDSTAWRGIVSVQGWYASIAELYLSDVDPLEPPRAEQSFFMATTAFIFSRTIFQALIQETYGASELGLLVAYLFRRRAHMLLNAVLLSVVKEYTSFVTNCRDDVGSAGSGIGNQLVLGNFTAFLSVVEDILFYSGTAYANSGTAHQADTHRKRGYTEEGELVVYSNKVITRGEQDEAHSEEWECRRDEVLQKGISFLSGDTMAHRAAPDGVWLHTTVAVRTMQLLTTSGAILNSAGVWSSGFGVSGSSSVCSVGSEPTAQGLRPRKGGFLRLFVRLFRVACSFTLRDAAQLDDILSLASRWVDVVDNEYGAFALLKWQWSEVKEHSPLSNSLTLILSLHELLNRRLRSSLMGPSLKFPDVNHEILLRMKAICALHRRDLNQMQFFSRTVPSGVSAHTVHQSTLDWLCGQSGNEPLREFVEVASREDYEGFISQCTLAMERDQLTDKGMVRAIEQYHCAIMAQLHRILTDFSVSRRIMLEALELHLQNGPVPRVGSAVERVESSAECFAMLGVGEVATVVFNTVWARFLGRCKGTIWDVDPAGQHNMKYVRLQDVEQKLLIRRKFEFDPCGTNHANITAAGASAGVPEPSGKPPPCARGGERILLTSDSCADGDEIFDEVIDLDDTTSTATAAATRDAKPTVHFSSPCEVPSMMHCWSAVLAVRDCELCVFFDEENKAYNQRVADGASSLIVKPRDIIYPTGHIAQLAPGRRFRMRRSAAELWFRDGRSVLLNFASVKDMRSAVSCIRASVDRYKAPHHPFYVFHEISRKEPILARRTNQWREHKISNFEYLLWLNFFGGRTVNDLTQYPVFPWVIADYKSDRLDLEKASTFRDLSLPIGICNGPQNREFVEMRYEEMRQTGDVPAHYFTHYSSPAVVLYYMIRVEPFTTLQIILQDGHFDCADRMFHSLLSCWNGVSSNSQDVRELIPELYYLPEMCMNTNGVRFGCRQDGRPTDSLELPPWAHGDPYEFIYLMREALESDYVSLNIHHWIDLIFGYKQRGKEAIAALNVFSWHSYEDLDKSQAEDIDERLIIDSLDNIGQTPIQVFTRPHVERRAMEYADPIRCVLSMRAVDIRHHCSRVVRVAVLDNDRVLVVCGNGAALLYRLNISPVMRRLQQPVASSSSSQVASPLGTVSNGGEAKSSFGKLSPVPSISAAVAHTSSYLMGIVSGASLPSAAQGPSDGSGFRRPIVDVATEFERRIPPLPPGMIPNMDQGVGGPCETDNVAVLHLDGEVFVALGGVFDNTVVIRPFLATPVYQEERLHAHCGRVVLVSASSDSKYLVSGAEDTTFIVWSCHFQRNRSKLRVDLLFTVYGHEDDPTAISVCPILDIVATASRDGMLLLHSLASNRLERSLRHPAKLPIDRVLVQPNCYLPNILFTSLTDNVIHQISINGVLLRSVPAPGRITGWCITPKQSVLVATVPPVNAGTSEEPCGALHFMHAFHLSVMRCVQCPFPVPGDVISSCACHAINPQAVVCGSTYGFLSLLCLGSKSTSSP